MPSEIAAAVILYAVSETKVFDASSALLASEIPVDKVSNPFSLKDISYLLIYLHHI
jgi:hypothetical protein